MATQLMNVNDTTCPRCLAKPGQRCTDVSFDGTEKLEQGHAERQNLARLGPCPHCGAGVGEPCFSKRKGVRLYEYWSRMECLAFRCDFCGAIPGDLCHDRAGYERGPHKCRTEAAEAAATLYEEDGDDEQS